MSSRISDNSSNYTLDDLPMQFENPLDGIDGIRISNGFNASSEISELKLKLQQKDWSTRSDAIQRIMSLIKGGVFSSPDFEFNEIAPDIAACVTDLRSTLVKWGSMCVSAAAQALGSRFASYVDIFIPSFFKQTGHGTAIISQSCRLAILQIAASVPNKRTARSILSESTSKSDIHRKIVAESIQKMQQNWPYAIYQNSVKEIDKIIKVMVSDKSPDVRKIAKEASEFQPSQKSTPSPRKLTQSFSVHDKGKNKTPQAISSNSLKPGYKKLAKNSSFLSTPASPTSVSASNNSFPRSSIAPSAQSTASTPNKVNSPMSKMTKESGLNSNSNSLIPKFNSLSKEINLNSNSNSSIPKINISLSKDSGLNSSSNSSLSKINLSSNVDSNSNPNLQVASINTPTTVASAIFLSQQLESLVRNPSVKKDKLAESVLQAIILTPNEKSWISHVSLMINEMPDEMKNTIGEILLNLNFNSKILKKALNVFGFDDIFNSHKRSAFKLRLSAVVLTKFPEFPMSDETIEMLKQLSRKKHKSSESDAVIINERITEKKMNQIIECLIEGTPYNQHLQSICSTENFEPIRESLAKINSILNENFFKDTENQQDKKKYTKLELAQIKERTLLYVENMSMFFPEIALDSLSESIVNIIQESTSEENSYLPPIAERCMLKLLNNKSCDLKISLIPLFDKSPNEAGIIVQQYLEGLQKDELKKYLNFLPDDLLPFLKSESVTVRRTIVMSYVQFLVNFGESFKKQLSKLSEVDQILVERFANKRRLI